MIKTKYFWTDAAQAQDRLAGCTIMYGDQVVSVDGIRPTERATDIPTAQCRIWPTGKKQDIPLDDPIFNSFRVLPPMGWVNCERLGQAVLCERRIVRSRSHGLNDSNVSTGIVNPKGSIGAGSCIIWRDYSSYGDVLQDPGYTACIKEEYPSLTEVFNVIQPSSTIAISRFFAVNQDDQGIRWLMKLKDRVGLFTGVDSLMLLRTFSFLREEIQEDRFVTVNAIQEF